MAPCICQGPKGRPSRVSVLSRPLPGIVIIETPKGKYFSITHELTGRALAIFSTQADAEGACCFLETLDWTIPKAAMTEAHIGAVRQVQWSAQMILWESFHAADEADMVEALDRDTEEHEAVLLGMWALERSRKGTQDA